MAFIQLLNGATSSGAPTFNDTTLGVNTSGLRHEDDALLVLVSTAGSGVMTVKVRLWGLTTVVNEWCPLGIGNDTTKGLINRTIAAGIPDSGTTRIAHMERVCGLRELSRLYAEITEITGTGTAVSLWLTTRWC